MPRVACIVLTCSECSLVSAKRRRFNMFNCETLANQRSASRCGRVVGLTHTVFIQVQVFKHVRAYRMGKVSKAFPRFGFKFEMSDKSAHFSTVLKCLKHLHLPSTPTQAKSGGRARELRWRATSCLGRRKSWQLAVRVLKELKAWEHWPKVLPYLTHIYTPSHVCRNAQNSKTLDSPSLA